MTYWHAEKNYEKALVAVMVEGAAAAGIELTIKSTADYREPEGDGSLIFGITKREILWDHQDRKVPLLYLDKGYCRDRTQFNDRSVPAWWRMCWQGVHPTAYFMHGNRPSDRWQRMNLPLFPRQPVHQTGQVVILGSSAKFHQTMRIEDPNTWARLVRDGVHRHCRNPITLRPKPSWKDAVPIEGMAFDWGNKTPITDVLTGAWCAITYGSIACVDAICSGVPCIVLGNGVAGPVSSSVLNDITGPIWQSRAVREQWAANLAYCNFTPAEIGDGTAWKILKEQMRYAF